MEKKNNFVYEVGNNLYINLTNQCSNSCSFCIRNGRDGMNGTPLWISVEPTAEQVIEQLPKDLSAYKEVVFCGFGEPTYRLDVLQQVGRFVKKIGARVRLNTNGHANEIWGHDVTQQLVGAVDTVSVSLNASDKQKYQQICCSVYGERAFDILLDFAKKCKENGVDVKLSVVDVIGQEEIGLCQQLCDKHGLRLKIRKFE